MMSHASGENVLVELEIAGQDSSRTALVQEVQHSPVGGEIRHVDFHAISMDQKIQAEVPLDPTGTAVGVKTFGGLLEQSLRALAIECLPGDLPDRITVDVSQLNIGDSIHVRDIQLPPGVTPKVQPDLTAFSVVAPIVEEEPAVAEAEVAAAGPEVITEKKEEGEGAAPAPAAKEKLQKRRSRRSNPISDSDPFDSVRFAHDKFLDFRFRDSGRETNPPSRRSRKCRSAIRGHTSQYRVHGCRSALRAVWIDVGEIVKVGRPPG